MSFQFLTRGNWAPHTSYHVKIRNQHNVDSFGKNENVGTETDPSVFPN